MPPIAVLALMVAALGAAVMWAGVFVRILRGVGRISWVREGLDQPPPEGRVAIVVPAHNEERVIDECALRMRNQDHRDLRIIFVLDRCTDRTEALLRRHADADPRIQIVINSECPPDWAGKCHAAWMGAQRALGDPAGGADWLVFTDADTRFSPSLVRAAVACAVARRCDLLSLLPRLTIDLAFERLVQPVAAMTLMGMYPIDRVDHEVSPRPFANGQFMLFRRSAYEALGGHESVRDDLLEDLAFARRIGESGGRVSLLVASDMLEVSMYARFDAFINGWRRIFVEACRRKPWRMRKNGARLLFLGVVQPLLQLALLAWALIEWAVGDSQWVPAAIGLVAATWIVQGATLWWIYQLQGASRRWIVAYPLGCLVVARVMFQGASDLIHRRPIRWGGRDYVLEPR